MISATRGHGCPRIGRAVLFALAAAASSFVAPAAANAATYLVSTGGADAGDCKVAPCATIDYAIGQHRNDPQPDDVIEVEAGSYAQNIDATDPADDGLTIRGELQPDGDPATELTGDGAGSLGCGNCIAALGASPATEVTMENFELNQASADFDVTPVFLDGGSDLATVDVEVQDTNTFAGVELCTDPGSSFDDVVIDAIGTDAAGISGCAAVTVVDSAVFTDDAPALDVGADPAETTEVTRSWMSSADGSPAPVLALTSGFVLDSALVTGGAAGAVYTGDPAGGASIDVNNSTVDPGDPAVDDGESLFIGRAGTDATIDSSVMVGQISVDTGSQPTTLTCVYSNFQSTAMPFDPDFTNDCPDGGDPGSTNTFDDPDDIFEDAASGDWSLQAGSPAIDAGQPGAVPGGFSTTDIDGDPRRVPGTTATCPDGVRDQGAFEAAAVSCEPPPPQPRTLTVRTSGTGAGTVTGPGIDCGGAGHTDCAETVPPGTTIELTATPAEGSRFDGFTGGGCSTSPCTVTLDSNKVVEAHFADPGVQALRIELGGEGRGVVTGPGIDCGQSAGHGDCVETYAAGRQATLTATPEPGSEFSAFIGGGCTGAGPCTVTMDRPHTVTASFDPTTAPTTTFAKRPKRPWPEHPEFELSASQARSTFECRVDQGDWKSCESRFRLRGLDPGKHRLRARATNPDGLTGPRATDSFRIPR